MAINVFRKQPEILVTFIKDLKTMNFPTLTSKQGKDALTTAILKVQQLQPLSVVKFDETAIKAVRKNNQRIVDAAENEPLKGGNIDAFTEICDQDSGEPKDLFEQTVYSWHGEGTAMHFVAY